MHKIVNSLYCIPNVSAHISILLCILRNTFATFFSSLKFNFCILLLSTCLHKYFENDPGLLITCKTQQDVSHLHTHFPCLEKILAFHLYVLSPPSS